MAASDAPAPGPGATIAQVIRVDSRQCEVLLPEHAGATAESITTERIQSAQLRGRLFTGERGDRHPIAVGDRVRLDPGKDGWAVTEVLPRRNAFARRCAGEDVRRQVLAANVDQVVLVACFGTPPFSSITTDRILAAASFAGIPALLVLNKCDLGQKRKRMKAVEETYRSIGIPVLLTSAKEGTGVDDFRARLTDRLSVLYGLSGVGKSSLLNCVEEGLGLRTREVSAALQSGRHTTTYSQLFPLANGGAVIDTPGARTFRPYGIPPRELWLHFPEMAALGQDCHFPDCQHRNEPKCRVLAALQDGAIPPSRHRSYLELLEELEATYG